MSDKDVFAMVLFNVSVILEKEDVRMHCMTIYVLRKMLPLDTVVKLLASTSEEVNGLYMEWREAVKYKRTDKEIISYVDRLIINVHNERAIKASYY